LPAIIYLEKETTGTFQKIIKKVISEEDLEPSNSRIRNPVVEKEKFSRK